MQKSELIQENQVLKSENELLKTSLEKQKQEEQHLKLVIKKLQHKLFGKSSEKRKYDSSHLQLNIFDFPLNENEGKEGVVTIKEHARVVREKLEEEQEAPEGTFPDYIPREEQVIDEKPEDVADEDLELVTTKVTERLTSTPEQHRVIRIVRKVYKNKATGDMHCAPAPSHVLDKRCKVTEEFLILMIVKKFLWHMPLYRQQQELKLQGIKISRESLTRWTIELGALLEPIARAIAGKIRGAPVVHVDETPVTVGKRDKNTKKKRYSNGQLWPILAEDIGVAFMYTSTRSWSEVYKVLKDFQGTVVSDAYEGYAEFTSETKNRWQLCWMHIRRNFIEALQSNKELAEEALDFIGKLYEIESEIKMFSIEKKAKERVSRSNEILKEFHDWLIEKSISPTVITDNLMSKAVSYVLKRWEAACLFVHDGAIPIDNGAAERAIRPSQLGAKNWLHCASELGAEVIAVFYTLIGSALINGIHPYYYLLDLTKRLDDRNLKAEDLIPSAWKATFYKEAVPDYLQNIITTGAPFVGNSTPRLKKY
jgi:transposase